MDKGKQPVEEPELEFVWPPPLPTLPLPCPFPPPPPPPKEIPPEEQSGYGSTFADWWDKHIDRLVEEERLRRGGPTGNFWELTHAQRRECMRLRTQSKVERTMWSIPLPRGSYPDNGLPVWQDIYLDRKLPVMRYPKNTVFFTRGRLGKKLWLDTKGQEFILYDPFAYEVPFPYENIHDPNLSSYYDREPIKQFLLSLGDVDDAGNGLCTVKRFNDFRMYLRRVHLALVHALMNQMDQQDMEQHMVHLHRDTMEMTALREEKRAIMAEAGAKIREALRIFMLNRKNRLIEALRQKEIRGEKLKELRLLQMEARKQRGLELKAIQELKQRVADEIARRKMIAVLRKRNDDDVKRKKFVKQMALEKKRLHEEKIRTRWQSKIASMIAMKERDTRYIALQRELLEKNVAIRNKYLEHLKRKQQEGIQALLDLGLARKAKIWRDKEDRKMFQEIRTAWDVYNLAKEPDPAVEDFRVTKSIKSVLAQLKLMHMEGPERFHITVLTRSRIEREQKVPLQVSYSIEVLMERAIEEWVKVRLYHLLSTVVRKAIDHGRVKIEEVRARNKDIGVVMPTNFKCREPFGKLLRPEMDGEGEGPGGEVVARMEGAESPQPAAITARGEGGGDDDEPPEEIMKSCQMGSFQYYDSPWEPLDETMVRSVQGRPKTPMPTFKEMSDVAFTEHPRSLPFLFPRSDDSSELKEKNALRQVFKRISTRLLKIANDIADEAYEPTSRTRAVNKLSFIGYYHERLDMATTLSTLISNVEEKELFASSEFHWVATAVAREAILLIVDPLEFQREHGDDVPRTKIMFYKPRPKAKKH